MWSSVGNIELEGSDCQTTASQFAVDERSALDVRFNLEHIGQFSLQEETLGSDFLWGGQMMEKDHSVGQSKRKT